MTLKVVIFNGPPRTGKGEAAKHMTNLLNSLEGKSTAHHRELKEELFKVASRVLGITVEEFLTDYDRQTPDKVWWMKDLVSISTSACMASTGEKKLYSQREWLIHISEEVIKPTFGKDSFGKMFVNSLPLNGVVFVSDGGFKEELQPVIDHVGADNILVVRINRDGYVFSNDSRSYLHQSMFTTSIRFIDVDNNNSLPEFISTVEKEVCLWLGLK